MDEINEIRFIDEKSYIYPMVKRWRDAGVMNWNHIKLITPESKKTQEYLDWIEREKKRKEAENDYWEHYVGNSMRWNVLYRDHFKCVACGKSSREERLEVDHIIPRCRGGKTTMENLQTLCHVCHAGKGRKQMEWKP